MSSSRAQDPAAVFNRAISSFESSEQDFIPAAAFGGPRAGFYFSKGPKGLGYYRDSNGSTVRSEDASASREDNIEAVPSRSRAPAQLSAEELLREAEDAAGDAQLQVVDAKSLKKLLTTLERKFTHNVEQRAKYADEPQRFLESEIELDEAVRAMTAVATSPELYPDLVAAGAVPILLSVLHHENGDIAADAIELLSELTDADAVEDSEEEARVLVDALLEGGLLDALVQRLGALNEEIPEEATAVYNALSVAENCIELKSEVAEQAGSQSGLLEWLLRRLRPKAEVDANKQYAAEVLAVVLQAGGDAARRRFMDLGGVDRALQSVAPYRSRDPGTTEEEEFVENVFNVLCAVIMDPAAKDAFVEAEGVELMVLILKGRTAARTGALKCLDFATTGCPGACDRAVDQGALGSIFALFMGKLKVKGGKGGAKRQDDAVQAEEEERAVSVISNLLAGVTSKARRDRVAAKFVENEFEKCDRLMEIYFRYGARVEAEEARLAEEADEDDVDEDELLLSRLDAGLYTLQQCALVAAELWAVGDIGVRRRLLALLHQRSRSLAALREVLLEHRATLAAEGEAEAEAEAAAAQERQKRVSHVTGLLEALGHKDGAEEVGQAEHNGGVDAGGESGGKRRREDSLGGEEEQRASRQKVDNASS